MTTASFLSLDYTLHFYGEPVEAQSAAVRHSWCDHDDTDVTVEFTIECGRDKLVNGYDVFYVWAKREERYNWLGLDDSKPVVSWHQSPKFYRFADAEAYCQFAYSRWQATGYLTSAAMELRDDLDANRNPVC